MHPERNSSAPDPRRASRQAGATKAASAKSVAHPWRASAPSWLATMLLLIFVDQARAQITYTNENGAITITRYDGAASDLVIPDTIDGLPVTRIGEFALEPHANPTRVTIGKNLSVIGKGAFSGRSGLIEFAVDERNPSFSSRDGVLFDKNQTRLIFYPQGKGGGYTVPSGVVAIEPDAFHQADQLTSVRIPATVTVIGPPPFLWCSSLTSITVETGNPQFSSLDGVLFDRSRQTLLCYPAGKSGPYRVPDGVTTIGNSTFSYCQGLTAISLPDGFTTIGDSALSGCGALRDITLPDSVTSIGEAALAYNGSVTNLSIGSGLRSLGKWALIGYDKLTGIQVAASNPFYTNVDGVWFDKPMTTLIRFPAGRGGDYTVQEGVSAIADHAFYLAVWLTGVALPDSILSIGESAFEYDMGLTNLVLPGRVASIGDSAFRRCEGLSDVTLPDSVTTIGERAFDSCGSLVRIAIGKGVTRIGRKAFEGHGPLASITVDEQNTHYSSVDGILFDKSKTVLIRYPNARTGGYAVPNTVTNLAEGAFQYGTNLNAIAIPDSVTTIGFRTFGSCAGLTNATIGRLVTSIGYEAFAGCSRLTSFTVPGSVTNIDEGAFSDCSGLTHFTIPDGVASIGQQALARCSRLVELAIGRGVVSLGEDFLQRCDSLATITVHPENAVYSSLDGVLFDKVRTRLIQYPGAKPGPYFVPRSVTTIREESFLGTRGLTSIDIPPSVASIGDFAFEDCGSLTSVTLHRGLALVGPRAFFSCRNLKAIVLPEGVGTIGDYAFAGCDQLSSAILPESLTNIANGAFNNCHSMSSIVLPAKLARMGTAFSGSALTSVTVPGSVASIGAGAFASCTNLTEILVDATNPRYRSVNGVLFDKTMTTLIQFPGGRTGSQSIPEGVLVIGESAYEGNGFLTSIAIPGSITTIGARAFGSCSALRGVTIPASVVSIGMGSFQFCQGLTEVEVPDSVVSMGEWAFSWCSSLTNAVIGHGLRALERSTFAYCEQLQAVTLGRGIERISHHGFHDCSNLSGIYFGGNAPSLDAGYSDWPRLMTFHHLPGTIGWGQEFDGRPTALWALPNPVMVNSKAGLEAGAGQFGFTISWATNATVVVETSPDAVNPVWSPVSTNTLVGGWSQFKDPQLLEHPTRFYRLRRP